MRRRWFLAGSLGLVIGGCLEEIPGEYVDERPPETVLVAPEGEQRFEPDVLDIEIGRSVEFIWESGGHNLVVVNQPEEADWNGVESPKERGFVHEHAFNIAGIYRYESTPDAEAGMSGQVTVGEVDRTPGDEPIGD